jgi:hypothetical protein
MVFGDARTYAQADDAIAHEITHGVTERESTSSTTTNRVRSNRSPTSSASSST